jgi:hypothetical protein
MGSRGPIAADRYGRDVYKLVGGKWVRTSQPKQPEGSHFLIVCDYGDWSGFRTLDKCLAQIPDPNGLRPNGFYRIVER